MDCRSYHQYAIVTGTSAQELTDQLNQKLYELRDKSPEVTFEGMVARIKYIERETVPDCLADEYNLRGVNLTCQDCPFFQPLLKSDGSEDRRARWGDCHFAEYGQTTRDGKACDRLFQMLNKGEVILCLRD